MAITIILFGPAVLLVVSALSLFLHKSAIGRILVYGASLIVSGAGIVAALTQLLGQGPTEVLTLPVGLPWLGAHFRLDALSAFFLVVVNHRRRGGKPLRARLRPARACAATRAAVLSALPRRDDPRHPRRRRFHLPVHLGIHVALVVGAGHGARPAARERARGLCLSRDGELRHARAAARLRPARRSGRSIRLQHDPREPPHRLDLRRSCSFLS